MNRIALSLAAILVATAANAELPEQCRPLYNEIIADVAVNVEQCAPIAPSYVRTACEPPHSFDGQLPASHLILAIDSSGSMAGSVGGESKMDIARREALTFLQDLDETVSVGLVVYGHEGNNQDDGKAVSCASSEMIHGFETDRSALAQTITSLRPMGWTPMGGVLKYSAEIIAGLPEPDGETVLAPVIYMISDGEETCDGDPAAEAAALYGAGVRTTVNTIGFAVDADTRSQLEAIAAAGGGTFYPAETGGALRRQLRKILEAELSVRQYESCVVGNANRIYHAYSEASHVAMSCYGKNDPIKLMQAVMAAERNTFADDPMYAECKSKLIFQALDDGEATRHWVRDVLYPFERAGRDLQDEYMVESGFPPLHGDSE